MKDYSLETIARLLPFPAEGANKYSRGKLTLIAGSARFPGAALLAAEASQRAGAGYTEAYVDDAVVPVLQMARPSLVVRPWGSWDGENARPSAPGKPHAYVIGSGFSAEGPYEEGIVHDLLRKGAAPVLVDGGALRLIADDKPRELCRARAEKGWPTVITPHGGEAAALAGACGIGEAEPAALSCALAAAYGAVCVLKGPDTYVSDGTGAWRMALGTAALSKAGTGDVLAGTIGALLAQGMDAVDACALGSVLHAIAGNLAAEDLSSVSVCAEDVIHYLPKAVLHLQKAFLDVAD